MAAVLRVVVMLSSCATALGVAASASVAQEAETSNHRHHRHHNSADDRKGQLNADDGSNLEVAIDRNAIVRREAKDAEEGYGTSPTPRPFSLAQDEPRVLCGTHYAPECAACPTGHGADWCHGDCHWVEDACVFNEETTKSSTEGPTVYPGKTDENRLSDDEIADKLRAEQEAAEEQERIDRNKFWATVGIAAGSSALLIMSCGLAAICFVLKRDAKAPKKSLLEEEGEQEAEVMEDEEFTVIVDHVDIYDSCEGEDKIGTLTMDNQVIAAGPAVFGRIPIKQEGGGAVEVSALQKNE